MINYCNLYLSISDQLLNPFPFMLLFGAHKEKEKEFFLKKDKKQKFEGVVIAITL